MNPSVLITFSAAFLSIICGIYCQSDYLSSAPATIFEGAMTSQNMDYDQMNKIFHVHPGWINDKLIYYYRFRVYSDMNYPEAVAASPVKLPISPVYIISTAENFGSAIVNQQPIVRYHHADGKNNSDIVQVYFVIVGNNYVANTFKSYGDIIANVAAADIRTSSIYMNLPIVPVGARLEDYANRGSTTVFAPISQISLWYRGVTVASFVFEVTDQAAKTFFATTRSAATGTQVNEYGIPVVQFVSANQIVAYLPIWHLNQYTEGVTMGQNNGGPWPMGQKNIINADRDSAYYSPIWGPVKWITRVPVGYTADDASNAAQLTEENGFLMMNTMMYANCPNVGPIGGGAVNVAKKSSFTTTLSLQQKDIKSFRVTGSLGMMDAGKTLDAFIEIGSMKVTVASSTANMMGAYSFTFDTSKLTLTAGTGTFKVYQGQMAVQSVPVVVADYDKSPAIGTYPSMTITITAIVTIAAYAYGCSA